MKSKLFSLIVSVLAAMCLWVYVMTVVNPDVDLVIGNIPVTFSGAEVLQEDHGLVITGGLSGVRLRAFLRQKRRSQDARPA